MVRVVDATCDKCNKVHCVVDLDRFRPVVETCSECRLIAAIERCSAAKVSAHAAANKLTGNTPGLVAPIVKAATIKTLIAWVCADRDRSKIGAADNETTFWQDVQREIES